MVSRRDAHDLLSVDWEAAERDKEQYWCRAKREHGAPLGLRVADELRRFAAAQRPGWPSDADRRADHAAHLRLAADLDRVSARRRSPPR